MNIKEIIKYKVKAFKETTVEDWVKNRRDICSTCPLNSKHTKWNRKNLRWWGLLIANNFKKFCTKCGCQITAKTLAETESCPKGKWKSIFD